MSRAARGRCTAMIETPIGLDYCGTPGRSVVTPEGRYFRCLTCWPEEPPEPRYLTMQLPRSAARYTPGAVEGLKGQTTRLRDGDRVTPARIVDARMVDPYTVEITLEVQGDVETAKEGTTP